MPDAVRCEACHGRHVAEAPVVLPRPILDREPAGDVAMVSDLKTQCGMAGGLFVCAIAAEPSESIAAVPARVVLPSHPASNARHADQAFKSRCMASNSSLRISPRA